MTVFVGSDQVVVGLGSFLAGGAELMRQWTRREVVAGQSALGRGTARKTGSGKKKSKLAATKKAQRTARSDVDGIAQRVARAVESRMRAVESSMRAVLEPESRGQKNLRGKDAQNGRVTMRSTATKHGASSRDKTVGAKKRSVVTKRQAHSLEHPILVTQLAHAAEGAVSAVKSALHKDTSLDKHFAKGSNTKNGAQNSVKASRNEPPREAPGRLLAAQMALVAQRCQNAVKHIASSAGAPQLPANKSSARALKSVPRNVGKKPHSRSGSLGADLAADPYYEYFGIMRVLPVMALFQGGDNPHRLAH
mmetsp:Transcript_9023/g.23682  ORF Transcript_9023/g.23682 Transcript_9023/m.23682 type:complete len:307 (+) Transcript_9023:79-999(+)|eukprot:CAMPEP_0185835548 /NCGR_PEP_ID=MMETSP1353-20130828/8001_1 /TAXON_ID=1077150 /ORGANISM="Erythrolobus australicus, Strain CCMP3124" /LENGTH=306 /DNA_ID=CAMNT_0028534203 /DNA_START=58 /DNA_END=978 /DNA_ORIENTATION=-